MARSSLLGIDPSPTEPAGRDKASLGPGDSSDSGSDMTGLDGDDDDTDPGLPVDLALRDDQSAPLALGESLPASEGSTGVREGADIGVDRVFSISGVEDDAQALIESVDEAAAEDTDDPDAPEDERAAAKVDAARADMARRHTGRS